ncbi:MAG: tRNA (adenosine(37)-N6)-threonylcarbamoyltransferase complex dimerization subunit type 1 TsaB [Pseudomonadota bacterium]|nr:tRNA (adenosine(37)-N6)-threonylcarbamoyltransferase complex dimerization subunit type 1 TsaB [Pseudomonadota bacterium]
MRKILSIDTSADFCAVAIVRDGSPLANESVSMFRGHAEALIPMVQKVCADACTSPSDIDLIGVTIGPGSFTGVRTGIAAARGFALAADCPAVGVSSLHTAAASIASNGLHPILVVLDTRRADYFVQLFGPETTPINAPSVMDAGGISGLIQRYHPFVIGNAVSRLLEEQCIANIGDFDVFSGDGVPDPVSVASIAEKILESRGESSDTLTPLYLKPPEAKIPNRGGRLKNRPGR